MRLDHCDHVAEDVVLPGRHVAQRIDGGDRPAVIAEPRLVARAGRIGRARAVGPRAVYSYLHTPPAAS